MNNVTNIYDIDGELIRAAGDNDKLTIEEAKKRLKHYEEKLKNLSDSEEDQSKKSIYSTYIRNLYNYLLQEWAKSPQTPIFTSSEQAEMQEQIEKAMNELKEEVEKEEAETEDKPTVMDEYVDYEEVE